MLKCYWADIALLEKPQVFEKWLNKVKMQRREKVLRCKHIKDKQRSLMAGVLLRFALEREGISYEEAEFSKTEEGKPYLLSNNFLYFSISHAGEYAVCIVSDMSVGADMECLDKPLFHEGKEKHLFNMAKKCLSEAEWDKFQDSNKKAELFLEYWTQKEAYSKAVGKGLGMEFSNIETNKQKYWSSWITEGYCISIYGEKGNYEELQIEKIKSLHGN